MLLAKLISDKSRSVSAIDWIGRISDGALELLASESGLSGGNARSAKCQERTTPKPGQQRGREQAFF